MREIYADDCNVYCTDKEKNLTGAVFSFKPKKFLTVIIDKELRVNLQYVKKHDIYVGSAYGLEFTTDGPKILN